MQAAIARHEAAGTFDSKEYQDAVNEYYKRFVCRLNPWPDDVNKSTSEMNMSTYMTMWGPSEFTATGTLQSFERAESLKDLSLPVLFTAGRYDEATPAATEYYRSLVPGARIKIFENSAHLTMQDEPDAYVRAIREFLREVETR